jgi:Spy/CpxP family protein refolding chaperone
MNKTILKYAARVGAVALCSAALSTVPMIAQGGGGGGMRMTSDQRVARVDAAVTLTDDQKTKVKAIYDADMKKMQDMRAAQDPDMMTKMQAMRADENKQIRALLTPDQQTKFDAMPQGRGPGGGGGGMGGPPPAQ